MSKILIACDSMKGVLGAEQVCAAAAEGVRRALPDATIITMPLADGGEGTAEIVTQALGGEQVTCATTDPLMRPIRAKYGIATVDGITTAIIDVASASGLTLLTAEERNPLIAATYGTGTLMLDAWHRGCRAFIIGLGGSATVDAGRGTLEALGALFLDADSNTLPPGTAALQHLDSVNITGIHRGIFNAPITVLTDVANPLIGVDGASAVYGPQKGASPADIATLELSLNRLADVMGRDAAQNPGAGAAGGLGYALSLFPRATIRGGIDALLDLLQFDTAVADATLVITGEGRIDHTTLSGKAPVGILRRVGSQCPVVAIAGIVADRRQLDAAGFADICCINDNAAHPDENPLNPTTAARRITDTVSSFLGKN